MRRALLLALLVLAACRVPPAEHFGGDLRFARGTFIVLGDSRQWIMGEMWRQPSGFQRRAVANRIAQERPDFIVNTGDLVAFGSDARQWAEFDMECSEVRTCSIPYYATLGNHDLWPDPAAGLANFHERFPHLEGRRWYGLRYGPIDVIVVDSNDTLLTRAQIDEQAAWYRDRLDADQADAAVRGVLVATHYSPFTNSTVHESSPFVLREFVEPARKRSKLKAFVTGHVHSYEHFVDGGIHFVVSGGGGAPLMNVRGPRGTYRDLYDGPRNHHFCRITVKDDDLVFEIVMLRPDETWFVADRFKVSLDR